MKFLRIHRRSSGFSLIEIMVALGILSVIIVAMLSMVQYMNQSIAHINAQQEVISLRSEIFSALSNSSTCQTAVTGSPKFDFNLAKGQGMPTQLTLPGGRVIRAGEKIGTIQIASLDFINAQLTGSSNGINRYRADVFLKVKNLRQSLGPNDLKGSTVASINISVRSTGAQAGRVQSCSSSADLSSQLWSCSDGQDGLSMLFGFGFFGSEDCCTQGSGPNSGGGGRTLFKTAGESIPCFFCGFFGIGQSETNYDRLCILD